MAYYYRKLLCEKASRLLEQNLQIPLSALSFSFQKDIRAAELHIPLKCFGQKLTEETVQRISCLQEDRAWKHISLHAKAGKLQLSLHQDKLVENVLRVPEQQDSTTSPKGSQTIVVEFSSPNIAKPFHAGHLRSTIIGNFIANVNEFLGQRVVRLNYLGDWGTQFGYLALGVRLKGLSPVEIQQNPILCLYEAYVHAHDCASNDPKIHETAMDIFSQMEKGSMEELQQWNDYRSYTVNELEALYRRLGVRFSTYEWESQYAMGKIAEVLEILRDKGGLQEQSDQRKVVHLSKGRTVPLVKSDGTGMYLLRDIAALLDRQKRYAFQRSLYVVENGQNDHFSALREIAHSILNLPYAQSIEHIKFGRVHGMSTRQGKVVFLKEILHEAQLLVQEKQIESPNTKKSAVDNPEVWDILGTSAVIINDLKQRRMKDYDFDWSKVLRMEGDSGIKLQYTHCRLASLLRSSQTTHDLGCTECDGRLLVEPEACDLICQIANFEPVCSQAQELSEACIVVNYLFRLCKSVNLALKTLPIKHEQNAQKRFQRIVLFSRAQTVLRTGMELLGLRPLEEM
ncbi:arginyl-tRNA synthetase [Anopheles darlingi]|uniref:Probable arginine--tRNA ligase, mitochondrial n=1 Tax=Anopheles darlingi TaxID=43151 RepID=W5JX47_ANODA|nr:probable arginine--tRNA ligase, mitochondrial [Anopheles darlingi]ETN68045.1 arginyl-tRNA synthetase [Anopheles darlingi]